MPYSDLYRSAMNKLTANDAWKAELALKIEEEEKKRPSKQKEHRTPTAVLWKKAGISLAAAAVFALLIVPHALRRPVMPGQGAMERADTAQAPVTARESLRTAPMPAALDQDAALACEPWAPDGGYAVSADSPEAALPPGTVFLKTAHIDDATLQNALAQLDERLTQDLENGLLSDPLTQGDVLASGVLDAAEHPRIVFVLPAFDPSADGAGSGTSEYLLYTVDVSALSGAAVDFD